MTPGRDSPGWRVYVAVGRVSNLPTVWTNCLAGAALATYAAPPPAVIVPMLSLSCFYTGGMFLNDAFDASHDRERRPERPIPRGLIDERHVRHVGFLLLLAGEALLFWPRPWSDGPPWMAVALGVILAALIVYYSWAHKRDPLSPLVMALCRACVYLIAGAWAAAVITGPMVMGAILLTVYVVALSQIAKRDLMPGPAIAALIAGISIVDTMLVVWASGRWDIVLLAACGFPLTLAGQRFTPGT